MEINKIHYIFAVRKLKIMSEEKNKYYTPSIEEFHIEFEFLDEENDRLMVNYNTSLSMIKEGIEDRLIKVKYLDKEDIESLGWKFQYKSIDEWFYWPEQIRLESGHYMNFRMHTGYHDHKMRIFAQVYEGAQEEVFFEGYIKNKSELKVLMKQLNIT